MHVPVHSCSTDTFSTHSWVRTLFWAFLLLSPFDLLPALSTGFLDHKKLLGEGQLYHMDLGFHFIRCPCLVSPKDKEEGSPHSLLWQALSVYRSHIDPEPGEF